MLILLANGPYFVQQIQLAFPIIYNDIKGKTVSKDTVSMLVSAVHQLTCFKNLK